MFSSKERENQKSKLANELTEFSDAEKKELADILTEIATANDKNKVSRKYLVNDNDSATFLGSLKIYKFAENSAEFKAFCLKENTPHIRNWTAILKKHKHPHYPVQSLDENSQLGIYELYMGAVFITKCEKADSAAAKEFWLAKACEIGFFGGLSTKLEGIKTQILTSTDPVKSIQECLNELTAGIKRLYQLYGATGFLQAAAFLYEIANALHDPDASPEQFEDMDNSGGVILSLFCDEFFQSAAIHFTCGKKLYEGAEEVQAKKLIEVVTQKQGLKAFGFEDMTEGMIIFFEKIKNLNTVYEDANKLLESVHPIPQLSPG